MAKTLKEARKRPENVGEQITPATPTTQNIPAVVPRELPGLSKASLGPAPPVWTTNYDSVKQFYRPGTSQQRFPPLPTKANPALNSQAASVATTIVNNAATSPAAAATAPAQILLNKQVGTSYTVQLSDRDTLISMTNDLGGVVVLPRSTSGFQYFQTAQGAGTNAATIHMTNIMGDTLIINVLVSPNVTLTTQTVSDTNGNTWSLLDTNTGTSEKQTMWIAYNVKGGPNTITVTQAYTPPTPPPTQFPFFLVAICDEFGGIVTGGLDQIGIGVASASITPTVTPSVAYCSILSNANPGTTTPLTPPAGWTSTPFSPSAWTYPAYAGGGPGGVINGVDEYILNPAVGTPLVGTATGSYIGSTDVILANFKTSTTPGIIFPYGWFCYIENTSTASYVIQSLAPIDGVVQNITLPPNTGLLLVADGQGGWWTERGAAAGGAVVTSLEGLTGAVDLTSSGATIAISVVGQNINLEAVGGGGGSVAAGTPIIAGQRFNSSDSNFAGDSIWGFFLGSQLSCLPSKWKAVMGCIGGTGVHVASAVVYRTAPNSLVVVDVTPITFGGLSTFTSPFSGATASNPFLVTSDEITVTLDYSHDYYVVFYFDNDGSGFNAALHLPRTAGLQGGLSGYVNGFLYGGFSAGDKTTTIVGGTLAPTTSNDGAFWAMIAG
jgi:hypothetical protein